MSTLPIDELRYQLWCMEQAFVPADHKLRAVHALLQGGTLALSLLISRLAQPSDPLFLKETLIPTGPLNPGPPRKMCVTLKYQIETILYEILCPGQLPKPELLGEVATRPFDSDLLATYPAPQQTLAEMKADWDDVRDTAIGELSPAELGASYAFISNWQSFWKVHGHKDLEALRTWSRIQVEAIWSGHLSGEFRGTHARLQPTTALGSVTEGHNSNVSQEHKFYTQAWALCSGALTESSRKPIAFKGLAEIEKRHPILAPHIEYLRKRLT